VLDAWLEWPGKHVFIHYPQMRFSHGRGVAALHGRLEGQLRTREPLRPLPQETIGRGERGIRPAGKPRLLELLQTPLFVQEEIHHLLATS
jgi:hypothetical protein